MIARPLRISLSTLAIRAFSTQKSLAAKNRIYTNVRHADELSTLLLLSSSSNTPLLTLWTTTWCSTCATVSPILKALVESEGVGEEQGGVGFVEVEMEAPSLGEDLRGRYMINSIPTLLAFSRGEPQVETKVSRLEDFKSRDFMVKWIESEARRGGAGGAGGSLLGGLSSWFGR